MYLFVKIEKYIILAAFKWKVLYFLPWFERTVEKEKSSKWDSSSYAPNKPIELQLWLLLQKWGANVGSCTSLAIWAACWFLR